MKSLENSLVLLLQEAGAKCGVATARDVGTLRARVKGEGTSFATITLPAYAKDFDRALSDGRPVPGAFAGFRLQRNGIPSFLKGFLHRIFDRNGQVLVEPSIDCIRAVRQICRYLSKVELPCSDARQLDAMVAYEEVDNACKDRPGDPAADDDESPVGEDPSSTWRRKLWDSYERVAAIIIGSMTLEDEEGNLPILCTHGPGATVEGYTTNQKWSSRRWHTRLEEAGLTLQNACFGAEKALWGEDRVGSQPVYVDPMDEAPVKVCFVPKTLKTPRVIAVEPACMQFAQQGLSRLLRAAIDHCRYTSGRIHFRDQSVNQKMALEGSVHGQWATVDLKDASDRVTCDHVRVLLKAAPRKFRDLVFASRSTRANLPDGRVIDLRKFASMGSALTFPVEATVFFCMVVASRIARADLYPCPPTVERMAGGIHVYGDDIVLPAGETPSVCDDLEAFGLRVNRQKSFWTGQFRESCGVDAFAGEVVTPIYLRRVPPVNRADASSILSVVSTANQLAKAGYWRTAQSLQEAVERLPGFARLPEVPDGSSALGWTEGLSNRPSGPTRWNRALQRREARYWVPTAVARDDPLEGEGALAKCFRRLGKRRERRFGDYVVDTATVDREHLTMSATPYAVTLKRRWLPV